MDGSTFTDDLLAIQPRLYQYARKLTTSTDSARNLLQDTVLLVLENRERYTAGTNFSAWCHVIMRNSFIASYHKALRERPYGGLVDYIRQADTIGCSTDDDVNTKDILYAVSLLPEKYYQPFTLYVSGFSYREISDRIGIPMGTVSSSIHLARELLKKQLGGE